MLRIEVSRAAERYLRRLPPKHGRQVAAKLLGLREDPIPNDSAALKGSARGYRRADIGEHRIVYRVEGETLVIALVGKRNDADVYRRLRRR